MLVFAEEGVQEKNTQTKRSEIMLAELKRLLKRRSQSRLITSRRRSLSQSLERLELRQLLAADLDFSTFFPSTEWEDGAYEVAQDSSGNAYVSSYRYDPVTFEAESAISKLSSTGEFLWSQEIEDYAWDIAVDDAGFVYFASSTILDDLPVTQNAFQSQRAGDYDLYVGVLDGNAMDGNSSELEANELIYASYLGGTGKDDLGSVKIATDGLGGIYLASSSYSSDFPTTNQTGVDSTLGGTLDGIVSYFEKDAVTGDYSLQMSSYVGGSEVDTVRSMAVDSNGTIHVAGATSSDDLAVTSNAYQATNESSGSIGFVARFTKHAELNYGSFFPDDPGDVAVDETGNTYLIGNAGREGFPVTDGAYAPPEIFAEDGTTRLNGNYVSKINDAGELEHSSWYQLSEEVFQLTGTSITLDGNRPVVTGWDSGGATRSGHLLRFAEDFSGLLDNSIVSVESAPAYSWISPSSVVDGQLYVVGFTGSSDFQTTAGALFPNKNVGTDGYVRRYTFGEALAPTVTPQLVTLDQDVAVGAAFAVMDANASSPDHTLIYSITGGNTAGAFAIDPVTGKVTINNPSILDFTNYQPTVLTITVADDQTPPQSNSATLTIQPFEPTRLAEDTFDSRDFTHGEGWVESEWQTTDYTYIVDGYNDDGHNYAGTMLQDDKGLLQRSFDSSSVDSVRLSFWTKLKSLERNDEGLVQVSSDGVNWQTVKTFVNGDDDDTWRFQEIEISTPGDRTYLRFDAEMSQSGRWWRPNYDYWYVDEVIVDGIDLADRSPLSQADSFSVDENDTLVIENEGVLANDVDPDGDAISAVLVAAPANGALNLASDGSFVYSPNTGFSGVDQFSYVASDGDLSSQVTTVSINIVDLPDNDPPVANNDSGTTVEDTSVSIDVLTNDSDPEGDSLTITSVTQPVSGVASIVGGEIQYSPDANFNGNDSFTYAIVDSSGNTATATVNVTVAAVNDAPSAEADSYSLDQDTTLDMGAPGVLSNDSDIEGDELTALLVAGPSSGSLTLSADGSFSYTPDVGFTGTDSFSYRAVDTAAATSGTVTVTLQVDAVASGPNLSHGVIESVSGSWQTVSFGTSYDSAVIVATPRYNSVSGPGVVRVSNVTSTSFDVRVDNAGSSPFSGGVHFIAMEEGVYDVPGEYKLEAVKVDTSVTSGKSGGWQVGSQSYQQSYSNPVVVGQIMSANDEDWSVFWSSSSSRTSPANSGSLNVGKHVAEDNDTTRATETLGYFVIESTSGGTIDGLAFSAGVGGDTVRGVGNGTYRYNNVTPAGASTAVLSSAGMDGGDGGWAALIGNNPLPAGGGSIDLAVDEDQIRDSERKHTTEQVAYLVIGESVGEGESVSPQAMPQITVHDPLDVNGDGYSSAIDVLQIINALNASDSTEEGDMALDTNGDGYVSPIDALLVINRLAAVTETSADVTPDNRHASDFYFADLEDDEDESLFGLEWH